MNCFEESTPRADSWGYPWRCSLSSPKQQLEVAAAAKAGDTAAARLVLSYAVGPPLPAADPDRLDANELEALRFRPNLLDRIGLDPLTPEPMSLFREEGD